MKEITEEQREKLPKWARDYLVGLEVELRASRKSLAERRQTKTVWGYEDSTKYGMASGYLPDDEGVRFLLDDHHHQWIEIRRTKSDKLKVSASHALSLTLTASNMLLMEVDHEYRRSSE